MAVPLIAAAIAYGLRVVGLRIIPYLVREGTRMAIKRGGFIGSPTVARKVGTKKITESGFVIIPQNCHSKVKNNIEYYLEKAGLIDKTTKFKAPSRGDNIS